MTDIKLITQEVTNHLADKETQFALVSTVFKDFPIPLMKQAMMEGMMRGFTLKDFLEKNVYAIKYGNAYSLITSIDYARKTGMKSGVCGKSEPVYEDDTNGKPVTCTVTVKRNVGGYVGDYTAKVYFSEYSTGKQLWASKPRTMIAKVAEMHALRMACPEALSQLYVEEEVIRETTPVEPEVDTNALEEGKTKLEASKTIEELSSVWVSLPPHLKSLLNDTKNEMKVKLTQPKEPVVQILSDEEVNAIN